MTPEPPAPRATTVVVATHGRAHLLAESLPRLLGQQAVPVEVLLVCDPTSNPETVALVMALGDPRVRVLAHDGPEDVGTKRNVGIDATTTPWVAFCDDDDLWAPDKLAAQHDALTARPDASWSCTGALHVDDRLRPLAAARAPSSGDIYQALLLLNVVPGGGSGVLADTTLIRKVGGFRHHLADDPAKDIGYVEDWDLWIRLAHASPVAAVDRPLLAYRVWTGSKSHRADRQAASHRVLEAHLAPERRRLGLVRDDTAMMRFEARQQVRARQRRSAARTYWAISRRYHLPGYLALALAALASPTLLDRAFTASTARAVPASWRREVAEWLQATPGSVEERPHDVADPVKDIAAHQ